VHQICRYAGGGGSGSYAVKILADENVFEPIIEYLRSKGYEVISVRSPELSGASDDEIYQKAVRGKLTIVTMDKDFLRIRRFPPDACGGIILIKIYRRRVDETTEIFRSRFEQLNEQKIQGKLVIITSEGIRIRSSVG